MPDFAGSGALFEQYRLAETENFPATCTAPFKRISLCHRSTSQHMPSATKPKSIRPKTAAIYRGYRIALLLQGGGALGAYQGGVYQALHEHGLEPDWVVGTSIGAINAALISGNDPANRIVRLSEFWNRIAHSDGIDMRRIVDSARRLNVWFEAMDTMARGVPGFFLPRSFNPFAAGAAVAPEDASFYDISQLRRTLGELVDFEYLNATGAIRLTVNAVKVTTGELVSFDSSRQPISTGHIMASGALPPGFPPIRIDGDLYWDGALYSNTPLETVLDDKSPVDTLCFMVDLWSAAGPEPTTLDEVQTRLKDVMYASRSKRQIEDYLKMQALQRAVRALYDKVPAQLRSESESGMVHQLGRNAAIHIVRLQYGGRDWNMSSKDINFSKGSTGWRWDQGYRDAIHAIEHHELPE